MRVAAAGPNSSPSQLDIYAPCALGGALDDDTVAALHARIVCGGANNQLAHPGIEKVLADRGILYAPDYVVNAGGVIQVADELRGFNFDRARARAEQIFSTTTQIFALADEEGVPPAVAADRLAEHRMSEVGRLRGIWLRPADARPGRPIWDEIAAFNGTAWPPAEARTPQSRYGYRCTRAGRHVVLQAVERRRAVSHA